MDDRLLRGDYKLTGIIQSETNSARAYFAFSGGVIYESVEDSLLIATWPFARNFATFLAMSTHFGMAYHDGTPLLIGDSIQYPFAISATENERSRGIVAMLIAEHSILSRRSFGGHWGCMLEFSGYSSPLLLESPQTEEDLCFQSRWHPSDPITPVFQKKQSTESPAYVSWRNSIRVTSEEVIDEDVQIGEIAILHMGDIIKPIGMVVARFSQTSTIARQYYWDCSGIIVKSQEYDNIFILYPCELH